MPVELRQQNTGPGDVDDWLGGTEGDLDWVDDATPPQRRRPPRRPGEPSYGDSAAYDDGRDADTHHDATIRRRRAVGLLVAFVVLGGIIWLAVAAFGGGSSGTATEADTTATTVEQSTSTPTTSATTTPTTPVTPNPNPNPLTVDLAADATLRSGDSGETVTQVQTGLTALGFDPGPADGSYGPKTEAAVVEFQNAKKLDADGVVGPDTAQALNAALAALPASAGSPTSTSTTATSTG